MFGDCCIPCLLLMLGATLSKGPGQASPPWRVVAAVAAARLVLLPLLGTGWLVMAKTLGEGGGASAPAAYAVNTHEPGHLPLPVQCYKHTVQSSAGWRRLPPNCGQLGPASTGLYRMLVALYGQGEVQLQQ